MKALLSSLRSLPPGGRSVSAFGRPGATDMMLLLVAALCLASGLAHAEPADERARLAAERLAVTQRLDQEEQACRLKFATTGCLTDMRARHRQALASLRERELSLADQDRQHRAQERRRTLAAKQQAAADRPPSCPSRC